MNHRTRWLGALPLALLLSASPLWAEFTLVLKNGRRITVKSYREEGRMIKFYGAGGEIGIPRDQIESIVKAGEEGRGFDIGGEAVPETPAPQARPESGKTAAAPETTSESATPSNKAEQAAADLKAKEEEDYREKLSKIGGQLKEAEDRYLSASRGNNSRDPSVLETEDAIRRRNDDINSRLRDAQHNPAPPSDAGSLKLSTPSPFVGAPPTTTELRPGEVVPAVAPPPAAYTDREKTLSELRSRMNQLSLERTRLIEEMKRKNLDTGESAPP